MPKRSKKIGAGPKFGSEVDRKPEPKILDSKLDKHLSSGKVSISLRYFQRSCECFSDWEAKELEIFAKTIEKVRGYDVSMLKGKRNLCEIHKNKPDRGRFSIPDDLSEDLPFYEIKVDQSNKLRIHGPFIGDVFFLVWLDREHECFIFNK